MTFSQRINASVLINKPSAFSHCADFLHTGAKLNKKFKLVWTRNWLFRSCHSRNDPKRLRKKQFQEKLYPFALLCNFALLLVPLSLFLFLTGPEGSLRESPAAGRCVAVCMQVFLNNEWGVVLSHRLLPTVKRCTDGWHSDLLSVRGLHLRQEFMRVSISFHRYPFWSRPTPRHSSSLSHSSLSLSLSLFYLQFLCCLVLFLHLTHPSLPLCRHSIPLPGLLS